MTDLFDKFDPAIAEVLALSGNRAANPVGIVMEEVHSPTEAIINGRPTILAGTYNYMGLTFHPEVIAAGQQALAQFGSGTTGSRVLNGTYSGHKALEHTLADFYGVAHAMVFSTGYQANLGICSTLVGKGEYILLDADSHASIYDGCSMGTADIVRFKHNDPADLDKRLGRLPADAGKLVVVEGVYSMLGDVGRLTELCAVARRHGAMILDDEAHAMGFYGTHGRGVFEEQGADVDFVVGTFSKSVGTVGGFCVSDHPKFDILRLLCRPYVFTASLPPSVVATARRAIELIATDCAGKRAQLWRATRRLHGGLVDLGFRLGTDKPESAIVAILMPDQETTIAAWTLLLEAGVYVNMARPPATPAGMYLLRMSVCAEHSDAQVGAILEAFASVRSLVAAAEARAAA